MKIYRIALVVPSISESGGVQTVAKFLLDVIQSSKKYEVSIISLATSSKDDCSIRLFSPSSWFNGVQYKKRNWLSRQYIHVGSVFPEFEFQRYRKRNTLRDIVKDFDVIQVVSGSPAFGCSVQNMGIPVVLQVATRAIVERRRHHSISYGLKDTWRKLMTRITDRIDNLAILHADAVMVENGWMEEYCKKISQDGTTRVVYAPPGVDTSVFTPLKTRSLKSNESYILTVGRLNDKRKNIGLLLDVYKKLRDSHKVFHKLILAGSSSPPQSFWDRAIEFGIDDCITFIHNPSLTELVALYQGAACFALSSAEEGFGMVIIEAMACGVPVVATRCGGPEGIINDGVDGYLVPMNDVDGFATKLAYLCLNHDLNLKMSTLARQKVSDQFDLHVAGSKFISMYDELLGISG